MISFRELSHELPKAVLGANRRLGEIGRRSTVLTDKTSDYGLFGVCQRISGRLVRLSLNPILPKPGAE